MANKNRDELERLREQAKDANRRVGRKLARLRREQKIRETGGIDPRLPADRIGRMNRIQLRSYLKRAERFIDRRTQYVGTSRGEPVERKVYDAYRAAERLVNKQRRALLEEIESTPSPSGEGTIGDFIRDFGADRFNRRMLTSSPIKEVHRRPQEFTSAESMRRLTESMLKEASKETRGKNIADWRERTRKMFDTIGSKKLTARFEGLSDKQFEKLWLGTSFVHSSVEWYEIIKALRFEDRTAVDDDEGELAHLLDWASKQ